MRRAHPGPVARTAALLLLVIAPLVAAVVALHGRPWWPTGDLAQAEMRARSLWAHPPLIGAAGRIGTIAERGSHPGPLAYWLLWPVYRVFGGTPWALETSVAVLNGAGAVVTVLTARRVAGRAGAIGAALAVVGLLHGFGLSALVQPWNPYLPLIWFAATMTLAWAVIGGDEPMWPALIAVGTLCVQCHIGYIVPIGGLGLVAWVATVWRWRERRSAHTAAPDSPILRRWWIWLIVAAVLGIVLWIAPLVDQLTHHPGNARILYHYFRDPPEQAIGFVSGLAYVLRFLNPVGGWVTGHADLHASVLPGIVLVAIWAAAAARTWTRRRQLPQLFALHVTTAAAMLLAWLAVSRIFGRLFGYLVMWVWVVTAAVVAGVLATLACELADRAGKHDQRLPRLRQAAVWSGVALLVFGSSSLCSSARGLRPAYEPYSRQMAALVPAILPKLDRRGRYQVTFDDPISLGGDAYGLILELERRGFTAGAPETQRVAVEPHRVLRTSRATAVLVAVSGPSIAQWRSRPGARLLAEVDPRTNAQRARYDRLRVRAIAGLRTASLEDLVPKVDTSIWEVANDTRTPSDVINVIGPMIDMGLPTAMFEVSPQALGP